MLPTASTLTVRNTGATEEQNVILFADLWLISGHGSILVR